MQDAIALVVVFSGFFLFLIGIYELSLFLWPETKKCAWEIEEDEARK